MNYKLNKLHWKNQDNLIKKILESPYVYDQVNKLRSFCGFYKLDSIILRKYTNKLPWKTITINQKLSEEIMREFEDYIDWQVVPREQILSEQFIKEFKDKMMSVKFWSYIPKYQKLSESFIEEFKDQLDWHEVSMHQNFSDAFANRYIDKIEWKTYFGYHNSSSIDSVSEGFIWKHLKDKFRNKEILKEILWTFPVSQELENEMEKIKNQLM